MPRTLAPGDHAFALGFAFEEVASPAEALALLRDRVALANERDAALLAGVWKQFRDGGEIGPNVRLALGARLLNLGERANVRLHGDSAVRGILKIEPGSKLDIGRFAYIGDGVIISAQQQISIGRATLLAHGVQVFDNNTHPTSAAQRELQFRRMVGHKDFSAPMTIESAPVAIGDRCWIGMNSIVMKGVTIGNDTIVAAGAVVASSLPEGVIAAGNPARIVRELSSAERESAPWSAAS